MIDNKQEYIICAAIHINTDFKLVHQPKNITNGMVVTGRRHHNCFCIADFLRVDFKKTDIIQGFITSKDRFVNRKEAGKIAFDAKQIEKETDCLMSEDLY